jgi:hypothetical protein
VLSGWRCVRTRRVSFDESLQHELLRTLVAPVTGLSGFAPELVWFQVHIAATNLKVATGEERRDCSRDGETYWKHET